MPNWTYLVLHFVHTGALAVWIGATLALSLLLAPALRIHTPQMGERVLAECTERLDRILIGCAAALVLTSAALVWRFGRLSPWYAIEYGCIAMMSASAFFVAVVTTPRIRRLDRARPTDPEVVRLRHTAALARRFNFACAVVALLFS